MAESDGEANPLQELGKDLEYTASVSKQVKPQDTNELVQVAPHLRAAGEEGSE